jgi:hypothetical protein
MSEADRWAKRALAHARVLSRGIGPRGATSDGERRAAGYVRNELKQLGLRNTRIESFHGAVSTWMPWAIAFSLALWGMLAGLFFHWPGAIAGVALHLLALWIIYRELYPPGPASGGYPIRRWLWQRESQNVVGVVSPGRPVERQVVLMGYLDSARAPFFWRTPGRRRLAGLLIRPVLSILVVNTALLLLGVITANAAFYLLAMFLTFFPTMALLVSLHAERAPFTPGANHNAAGVGTLLALAERLKEAPLARTEVWLLATGCRETGGDGVRAFLKAHGETLASATFVALEGVGVGEQVVYLRGEGLLRNMPYPPKTLALAARAAAHCHETGLEVRAARHRGGPTEMGILAREGLEGVTVSVWPDPGQGPGLAGRRRVDDTFETLEKRALAQVHTFAWALLQEIDTD